MICIFTSWADASGRRRFFVLSALYKLYKGSPKESWLPSSPGPFQPEREGSDSRMLANAKPKREEHVGASRAAP